MLTAIDGQVNGGGGSDKFRIKIWDKNNGDAVVYDNQVGAADDAEPSTEVGGGQVVIHKGGQSLTTTAAHSAGQGISLTQEMLDAAVQESLAFWAADGASAEWLAELAAIDVELAELDGSRLGVASSSTNKAWLDVDGAGLGWSLEGGSDGFDLVSAVTHELGHKLGLDHDVLGEMLDVGVEQFPATHAVFGDANRDRVFNRLDIVQVMQAGKYQTGQPAGWHEGDWNGDGRFDQHDLITALQHVSEQDANPTESVDVDAVFAGIGAV